MSVGRFNEPVRLSASAGRIKIVSSARQAADLLGAIWPVSTPSADAARSICSAVLDGHLHPKLARGAFHRAAQEAKLLAVDPG